MITIRNFEVRNFPHEYKLGEWEKQMTKVRGSVFDPENPKAKTNYPSEVDKWIDIFLFGGFPKNELKNVELEEFKKGINDFNERSPEYDVQKEFEINGKIYRAFEDEFKINVVKWGQIEKLVKRANGKMFLAEIVAVLFEDISLTDAEHKADAHVKNKAKIFREHLTAEIAMPYFTYVVEGLYRKAQIVNERMKAEPLPEGETPIMKVVND